jgi:hypothetical protein
MWLLDKKQPRFPKSFYEKAQQLAEQARNEPDPEIRKLQLEAAERYYVSDTKPREPFLPTLLALVIVYVVVIGTAIYAFRNFSFPAAVGIVIASYAFLAFIVGASFRAAGYLSESSFMGIFRGGVRILLFLRKQSDKGQ